MKTPHLFSGLLVLVVLFGALIAGSAFAVSIESRYVHALAPVNFKQKTRGNALTRLALNQPDLLTVYGASEWLGNDPYQADNLFKNYPSGFKMFTVADNQVEPIIILQELASVSSELRGKKIVITISPDFVMTKRSPANAYAFNFSPLNACQTIFNTDLSLSWKEAVARRMLDYPATLEKYPLYSFALSNLADGSFLSLAGYYAALPLGKLACGVLELQDHWEILTYLQQNPPPRDARHISKNIDWDANLQTAEDEYAARSNNNPFGFDNGVWKETYHNQPPDYMKGATDDFLLSFLNASQGWTDLNLLLQELQQLGADPLIFSAPLHGPYMDYSGISQQARQVYYDKLRAAVKPFDFYLLDFQDHEADNDFEVDALYHLSSVGWVYYGLTIDAFYHNRLYTGK